MDLHFHGPNPTQAEQAAVDSVLGPPTSAWAGGVRNVQGEGHSSVVGGHLARSRRDLLLPAFTRYSRGSGGLRRVVLDYICRRLTVPPAEAHGSSRSTICSRWSKARRQSPICVTTSPAGSAGQSVCAPSSGKRSGPRARGAGNEARAWACANRRPRHWY